MGHMTTFHSEKAYYLAQTALRGPATSRRPVKQKGPQRSHAAGPEWWTESQPIRTLAELPLRFALVDTAPSFVYLQIAEKVREPHRLGMSACAIAQALNVSDKTVAKALRQASAGLQKGR